jgi:hypothetical protein
MSEKFRLELVMECLSAHTYANESRQDASLRVRTAKIKSVSDKLPHTALGDLNVMILDLDKHGRIERGGKYKVTIEKV